MITVLVGQVHEKEILYPTLYYTVEGSFQNGAGLLAN